MSDSSETCTKEIKYSKSEEYWATQPATVNGMLGGYEHISDVDIEQSQKFLDNFLNSKVKFFSSTFRKSLTRGPDFCSGVDSGEHNPIWLL